LIEVIVYSSSAHSRSINISHTVQIRSNYEYAVIIDSKTGRVKTYKKSPKLCQALLLYMEFTNATQNIAGRHIVGRAVHGIVVYCNVRHCIVADHAEEVKGPDKRAAVSAAVLLTFPPSAKLSLRSLSFEPKECLPSVLIFTRNLDQYGQLAEECTPLSLLFKVLN
jgi:hypothetical protein